jgi:hypothetical protein
MVNPCSWMRQFIDPVHWMLLAFYIRMWFCRPIKNQIISSWLWSFLYWIRSRFGPTDTITKSFTSAPRLNSYFIFFRTLFLFTISFKCVHIKWNRAISTTVRHLFTLRQWGLALSFMFLYPESVILLRWFKLSHYRTRIIIAGTRVKDRKMFYILIKVA